MEVEHPLFVEESALPRGHAIHFHVMCSSECQQMQRVRWGQASTDQDKREGKAVHLFRTMMNDVLHTLFAF